MFIIGLDFGNCYSFPCFIRGMNAASRLGGTPVDLLPADRHYGYPSVFFYSRTAAERSKKKNTSPPPWCGEEAVSGLASPRKNRMNNLKRHLGQPLVLDDWKGSYDDAIVQMIQYLVRRANQVLQAETMTASNQISLAHPATYNLAQCARLKELAEKATLEDGRHVEVVGMIDEPAAAALDYLVENGRANQETTVLTYDLGGGTFDLAVVTAFPQGKKDANGKLYYYDVEKTGGDAQLGGTEFDAEMFKLLKSKVPSGAQVYDETLRQEAEKVKIQLSRVEETGLELTDATGDTVYLEVTRAEFERQSMPLIQKTVARVRAILENSKARAPELIVLTGGASQMPAIQRELEKAFPAFRGKIVQYRPSRAIAYGAARYGTLRERPVQRHVPRTIGIRFYEKGTDREYIDTYIEAGTPLPFVGAYSKSTTRNDNQKHSFFGVYEAKVDHPDPDQIDRDYMEILSVTLDHGGPVPKGTPTESRLLLSQDGLLEVQARDPAKPDKPVRNTCVLKSLS